MQTKSSTLNVTTNRFDDTEDSWSHFSTKNFLRTKEIENINMLRYMIYDVTVYFYTAGVNKNVFSIKYKNQFNICID